MKTERILTLGDPGGVRPVAARWTIAAEMILDSATHFGGGAGDATDMVLLRDARTGGPLLPGTSIAGALRSHLSDALGGYRSREDARVSRLFGGSRGDDLGAQSPLIVFDSIGTLPDDHAVEIRDGVQIDAAPGTVEDHKKFDFEVLPAGTSFPVRFDLVVPKLEDEGVLVSLLVVAVSGLSRGDIALGSRRSRGFGAVRATNWRAARHELTSREGWIKWLLSDGTAPLGDSAGGTTDVREACQRARADLNLNPLEDRRRRFVLDAMITATGGLLVRSAPTGPDAPDAAHLRSAGCSVLPGTAVAGVLRNQALRIARIARHGKDDAERWVNRLFGPRMDGATVTASPNLFASRLRVSESVVEGGRRSRPSRMRIDRFTQGVAPGALFDDEPEYGGRVRLRLEVREPESGDLGLLLLVLKDLLTGELTIGGTSAVGRGRFKGTATLRLEDGRSVELDPAKPPDPIVNQAIGDLWSSAVLAGVP